MGDFNVVGEAADKIDDNLDIFKSIEELQDSHQIQSSWRFLLKE